MSEVQIDSLKISYNLTLPGGPYTCSGFALGTIGPNRVSVWRITLGKPNMWSAFMFVIKILMVKYRVMININYGRFSWFDK